MVERPIHRLVDGRPRPETDELADESIITISCQGEIVVRLLASPTDLADLAYGHIICEGRGSIDSVSVNGHEIEISGDVKNRPTEDLLTAACGACTTGDIESPSDTVPRTIILDADIGDICLLYTSPSPRDKRQSRMPSSA